MKQQELRVGNLFYPINRSGSVHVPVEVSLKICEISISGVSAVYSDKKPAEVEDFMKFKFSDISPIPISEEYLLSFGFKKIENTFDDFTEIQYELETEEVYFNYSDDWSIAIADSKKTFLNTGNYIAPSTKIADKIHLLQNLFYSLTGKEIHENSIK